MSKKCYSERTIQNILNTDEETVNVSSGEICTIENSIEYGIFHKKNYFKNNDDIDPLIGNKRNTDIFKYSLCDLDKTDTKIAYNNCVLSTGNPWMTADDNNKLCILPDSILFPKELKKKYNSNTSNYILEKPSIIFRYINDSDSENKLCEDKWYEWFSIPDFYLGNKNFYNIDDDKCYSKCKMNYIPVAVKNDTTNNIAKQMCISKKEYNNGLYSGNLPYIPIALIFLLGCTKDYLIDYYLLIFKTRLSNKTNFDIDIEIYNNVLEDKDTQNNIYIAAKNDIKKYRDEFILLPIDSTNIVIPSDDVKQISNNFMDKSILMFAYDMCKKIYDDLKDGLAYNKWKIELLYVNGYTDLYDWRLNKQIVLFKKASNILFNGKSDYSKNSVLYTLNYNSDTIRIPFEFDLNHSDELQLSYSPNPAYNGSESEKLASSQLYKGTLKSTLDTPVDSRRTSIQTTNANDASVTSVSGVTGVTAGNNADIEPIEEEEENTSKDTSNIIYGPKLVAIIIGHIFIITVIIAVILYVLFAIYKKIKKELNVVFNMYFLVLDWVIYYIIDNDNYNKVFLEHLIRNVQNNIYKLLELLEEANR
jgi:hypothetical protein